jgi:hypothetical protein
MGIDSSPVDAASREEDRRMLAKKASREWSDVDYFVAVRRGSRTGEDRG